MAKGFLPRLIEQIDKRIKTLSKRELHFLWDYGFDPEKKPKKIYHLAGSSSTCDNCTRIDELKVFKKESMNLREEYM